MITKKLASSTSKRGLAVMESIFVFIMLFVFVFITIFGYKILSDMEPTILEDIQDNASLGVYNEVYDRYPNTFDALFMLLFVGCWVFLLVAAYMANDHPILFGISLFIMVFIIIAVMILGNFYEDFFTDSEVSPMAEAFPMMNWIFTHLLTIVLGVMFSMGFLLYMKLR